MTIKSLNHGDWSRMSNILIFGAGHLGKFLKKKWPNSVLMTQEIGSVRAHDLERLSPPLIVNCAGKTDVTWCENNQAEAFRNNVEAPLSLYRAVKKAYNNTVPFVQMSSGCLWEGPFDGEGNPFTPKSPASPACFYAWSKAICDAMLLQESDSPLLILRPRMLYSSENSPRNLLTKLRSYPNLVDTANSITSLDTVCKTIECVMLAQASIDSYGYGRVMNVYDRGVISPFEIGQILAEFGLRAAPEKMEKSDLNKWHRPKRVDVVMDDPIFEMQVRPPAVQDELRRVIAEYKEQILGKP